MELDREDAFPQPDTLSVRPTGPAPDADAPALWTDPRSARVPVVVKKRRLAGPSPTPIGIVDATEAQDAGDERRPRVFVLPREPQPEATIAAGAEPTAPAAAAGDAQPSAPRRGHRRAPWRRPSPVVHIVVAPPADGPAAAAQDPDAPELPAPPAVDGYREVQAALAQLRRQVEQARAASAFVFAPALRRRRAG